MKILFKAKDNFIYIIKDDMLTYEHRDELHNLDEVILKHVPYIEDQSVICHVSIDNNLYPVFYVHNNTYIINNEYYFDVVNETLIDYKDYTQVNINRLKDGNII